MTIPRYMASTAASLSKNKTTTASKTPLKNKTPFQRGGRVSKIPRLETVNVKQLKPLLEQKADPLRAQELANLWTRPRGILKPFQSDLLIRPPPPKFDDEDEETGTPADVDEVLYIFIFITGSNPKTKRLVFSFSPRFTPRSFSLFGGW